MSLQESLLRTATIRSNLRLVRKCGEIAARRLSQLHDHVAEMTYSACVDLEAKLAGELLEIVGQLPELTSFQREKLVAV